jgi:hypothetical protein
VLVGPVDFFPSVAVIRIEAESEKREKTFFFFPQQDKHQHSKQFAEKIPPLHRGSPRRPLPTHQLIIKNNSFVFRLIKYVNYNSFQLFFSALALLSASSLMSIRLVISSALPFGDSSKRARAQQQNMTIILIRINSLKFFCSTFPSSCFDVLLFDMKYRYMCYVRKRRAELGGEGER